MQIKKAYPPRLKQLFTALNCKKPLKMSIKFDSIEHVLSNVGAGYTTDYVDRHYLIYPTAMGDDVSLDDVLPLAYTGKAAAFGETDTACKGFAFALEDYFASICRTRVLMIKEGPDGLASVIDDGWQQLMEWRERPSELSHATKRPPVNFQVDLRAIANQVMDGTWPQVRFSKNQPKGQFCALLFPPGRMERDLWPVYTKAREALKAYRPESFMEEAGCCWNSLYRAGGEWCPPLEVAEGNFFYKSVKQHLTGKVLRPPVVQTKKPAPRVVETDDSDEDFADAVEGESPPREEVREADSADASGAGEVVGPQRPTGARPKERSQTGSAPARSRNPHFTVGEDCEAGRDPISNELSSKGYTGAEKRNLYKMVRMGQISLAAINPKQDKQASSSNKRPAESRPAANQVSRRDVGVREFDDPEGYPAPTGEPLRFANFEGTRKLNAYAQRGAYDKLDGRIKSPREEWLKIKVPTKDKVSKLRAYLKEHPEGAFQDILDWMRRECKSERSYLKVLGILNGIILIDLEGNAYSVRKQQAEQEDSSDEEQ